MSSPESLAEAYKFFLKRKKEIWEQRAMLNAELKRLKENLEKQCKELGQGDLFTKEEINQI